MSFDFKNNDFPLKSDSENIVTPFGYVFDGVVDGIVHGVVDGIVHDVVDDVIDGVVDVVIDGVVDSIVHGVDEIVLVLIDLTEFCVVKK